jgi:hypothetical protein
MKMIKLLKNSYIYFFKNIDKKNMDLEEMDNSNEFPIISTSTAIAGLEIFILTEYVKLMEKILLVILFCKI